MMGMGVVRRHRLLATVISFAALMLLMTVLRTSLASAAACTAPSTDYGTVSGLTTTSLPAGTYKIWSRMVAADTTNNTYMLEVDGGSCYTVGGSAVQTYTAAQDTANTRFSTSTTNTSDWIAAGTNITFSTAGTHTLKLIGTAPNVVVDRVILTQDLTATPHGLGDDVANPPDTTDPVVNITSATNTASGTVTIASTATDDSGIVSKVELYVDNSTTPAQTDTSSPYGFTVTGLSVGTHTFTLKAYDAAPSPGPNVGTSNTVSVVVKDQVAPTVSITSPAANSSQSGSITVAATAADNIGVTKVEFYLDGTLKATDSTPPGPFSGTIDVSAITGTHLLTAKAYDSAGNATTSNQVSITVTAPTSSDTTGPTIGILTPLAGIGLSTDLNNQYFNSSAYSLSATAADASGVKSVTFKVDGVAVGAVDTAAPYTATLDLTKYACSKTAHTLTVTATDNSANANVSTVTSSFYAINSVDIAAPYDCHDTYLDLSFLAGRWPSTITDKGRADINKDGTLNYLDLSALGAKYNIL